MDNAFKRYEEILELFPDHPTALGNSATILSLFGHYDRGVERARAAVAREPDSAAAHSNLGMALETGGLLEEAERVLRRAIALDPSIAEAHVNLGNALQKTGRHGDAAACYRAALDRDPRAAVTHNNLGNALMALGEHEAAMESFRQALAIDSGFAEAHGNVGILQLLSGVADTAVESFQTAIAINPHFANAHYNLGVAYTRIGDTEGAIAAYRGCLEANPAHAEACLNFSKLLLDEGRLREAVPTLRRAAGQNLTNPMVLAMLATLLADGADLDEALSMGIKAYLLDDTSAPAICSLSKALVEKGSYGEAAAVYDKLPAPVTEHDVVAHGWLCESLIRHQQAASVLPLIDRLLSGGSLTLGQRHRYVVTKAIQAWLSGDIENCAVLAAEAAALAEQAGERAVLTNPLVYQRYLGALLDYRRIRPELYADDGTADVLHVIGESHSLSLHGSAIDIGGTRFRFESHMIVGCKAWHLADPTVNYFQRAYWAIVNALPEGANLLVTIGEIDCRYNEGIYPLHRKTGTSVRRIVDDTVGGFVEFTMALAAKKGQQLNLCGVPAPLRAYVGRTSLAADERACFVDVARRFNDRLEARAAERGVGFADLYRLTAEADGMAGGRHHVDDIHLVPAAYHEAIANDANTPAPAA